MDPMLGRDRYPHKYVKKVRKNGKVVYIYAPEKVNTVAQAIAGAQEHKVVIAHGKPTSVFVDNNGFIVHGPPNTVGKVLMVNQNRHKSYFGVARDIHNISPAVYLYPESAVQKAVSKKAAKFLNMDRGIKLLDKQAVDMMSSYTPLHRQYGLLIYLNNNSRLRIGAHEDAASVDPKERSRIINQAKKEGWSDKEKAMAMEQSRQPTYGLLTLRRGALTMDDRDNSVTFNFVGKGGKLIEHPPMRLPPLVYSVMKGQVAGMRQDDKVFNDINYKKVWRMYKQIGLTPHVARGAFAESMVNQLIKDFKVQENESGKAAFSRFNNELKGKVSDYLHHTRSMTEKSYISTTTQKALNEFRTQLASKGDLKESEAGEHLAELAEAIIWLELGPGNTVI